MFYFFSFFSPFSSFSCDRKADYLTLNRWQLDNGAVGFAKSHLCKAATIFNSQPTQAQCVFSYFFSRLSKHFFRADEAEILWSPPQKVFFFLFQPDNCRWNLHLLSLWEQATVHPPTSLFFSHLSRWCRSDGRHIARSIMSPDPASLHETPFGPLTRYLYLPLAPPHCSCHRHFQSTFFFFVPQNET